MKTSWDTILSEQATSGLSIKRFCEQRGLRPSLFHYHKRRLREASLGSFIEVSPGGNDSFLVELSYPNGVSLKLRGQLSIDQLKRLVHV